MDPREGAALEGEGGTREGVSEGEGAQMEVEGEGAQVEEMVQVNMGKNPE